MNHSLRRGGFSLEALISVAILATLLTSFSQLVLISRRQKESIEQRQMAIQETANLMERIMLIPWDQLDTEMLTGSLISEFAVEHLTGVQIEARVTAPNSPTDGKLIQIALSWVNPSGERVDPIHLSSWRYQDAPSDEVSR